jgi:hypothetical protein
MATQVQVRVLSSRGAPFRSRSSTAWKTLSEDWLSPIGELVPAGARVKLFQTRNFGFVLIAPDPCVAHLTRRLFKE